MGSCYRNGHNASITLRLFKFGFVFCHTVRGGNNKFQLFVICNTHAPGSVNRIQVLAVEEVLGPAAADAEETAAVASAFDWSHLNYAWPSS